MTVTHTPAKPGAMMRQSAVVRGTGHGWMDRERAFVAEVHPGKIRVETDPYAPLEAARRDNLERIAGRVRASSRMPRVCLYALSVGGQEPRHSLVAVRQSWQVGVGQSYSDHHGTTDPLVRPGWCTVRQQIRAGYADGVVVITPFVISPHASEYKQQLEWFAEHFGFIAVVAPDAEVGRR
ncbi:hypothetical protein [Streptomyces sp. NBRC 110611]|uniref:hypothetical protein n=1 Tax=Streptomyces sp. NBRC 110611 TaxID=1621259 RepID=UPI00215C6B74|nr:hypothetical protein [Streptomyces sp. NBRC 110611]